MVIRHFPKCCPETVFVIVVSLQKTRPIVAFFSSFCQKHHYRYPIVAFSINAAIGISIATFMESYSSVLKQWVYSTFPSAYSGVYPGLTNAVIGLKKKKTKKRTYSGV